MHHQSCGLVQNDQRVIFKNEIDRNILRSQWRGRSLVRNLKDDFIPRAERIRRLCYDLIDEGMTVLDEPLEPCARKIRTLGSEKFIQTLTGLLRSDKKLNGHACGLE